MRRPADRMEAAAPSAETDTRAGFRAAPIRMIEHPETTDARFDQTATGTLNACLKTSGTRETFRTP